MKRSIFILLVTVSVSLFYTAAQGQSSNARINNSEGYSVNKPGTNPAANLDQLRNGKILEPVNPANWVNGNIGGSSAHFAEGHSIPFRVIITNPPAFPPIIFLTIEFEAMQAGKHTVDFITGYDNLQPHDIFSHDAEVIDPTIGTGFFVNPAGENPPDDVAEIPSPGVNPFFPNSTMMVNGVPQPQTAYNECLANGLETASLWGGTFVGNGVNYSSEADLTQNYSRTQVTFTIKPDFGTTECVIAWGGHIATESAWGEGNTAVAINGSPYHTRLFTWNIPGNNLGQQDLSCNSNAITLIPGPNRFDRGLPVNESGSEGIWLNAYPNPFSENITIETGFDQKTDGSIDIFNLYGSCIGNIAKGSFESGQKYLYSWKATPKHPAGIYLIRVTTGYGSKQFRIALIR